MRIMKSKNTILLIEKSKSSLAKKDESLNRLEKELDIQFYSGIEQLEKIIQGSNAELLLFLSPYATPTLPWVKSMKKQLQSSALVGGDLVFAAKTPVEKTYAKLFSHRSKKSIQAVGFALPWASFQNLGIHRKVWIEVGPLSRAADFAAEKDWCWRAVLQGYKIQYNPIKLKAKRSLSELQGASEFFERGQSEAWLKRTYNFLTGEDHFVIPLSAGLEGFQMLWQKGDSHLANLAFSYGSGMQWGYSQPLKPCPLKRVKEKTISWNSGKNETTIFVPGKGLATMKGKMQKIFQMWESGIPQEKLQKEFQKLFLVSKEEAITEVIELSTMFTGN
jgi:hypothetical protein